MWCSNVSLECQLLFLFCQWCLHSFFSVTNGHNLIANTPKKWSVVWKAVNQCIVFALMSCKTIEIQTYFMFILVVRAVNMCLHYLTWNTCPIFHKNPRVQGGLTFFTLNSPSYSIHNLEGSMFMSEQDTRIIPRGEIHLWAPVHILLCAKGVI